MKRKIFIILTVFFLVMAYVLRIQILQSIGGFLVVSEPLKKADVIVVLGGEMDRVDEGVKLYKEGWAGHLIMTGGAKNVKMNLARRMRDRAVQLGVSEDKIILEPESLSTYQHPIFVGPIMAERGFQSAIIISSPYHMRRSSVLFNQYFKHSGFRLIYHSISNSWFNPRIWWMDNSSREIVKREYAKLLVNIWGRRVNDFFWRFRKNKMCCELEP